MRGGVRKMSSAVLAKTIAKLPTKTDKPKPASSLANLCTETLWKQSIASGKAEELVATLRATPEGRCALAADAKAHSTRVFIVNIFMDDGRRDCLGKFVSLTEETAWFFELLDAFRPTVFNSASGVYHPLGGYDLRWDDAKECVHWAHDILRYDMHWENTREFVRGVIGIEVPVRLECGTPITDVTEWLDENHEDWFFRLERKFLDLFDVTGDRDRNILSAQDVHTLRKSGWNPVSEAVVTIDLDDT